VERPAPAVAERERQIAPPRPGRRLQAGALLHLRLEPQDLGRAAPDQEIPGVGAERHGADVDDPDPRQIRRLRREEV